MFQTLPNAERIELAKDKIKKVLDHFLDLIQLHENNAIVVYSSTLSSQLPESYAAHAFNVFQRAMHQFEIVRLCALWDKAELEKENVPTVVELVDSPEIIDTLAEEFRRYWAESEGALLNLSGDPELRAIELDLYRSAKNRFADEQASKARAGLRQAIGDARNIQSSEQLASVFNLRDKHLAHSLSRSRRETKGGPIEPMKFGDETDLLNASIPIVENLCCWVSGTSYSIAEWQQNGRKNAEALWHGCKFKVLR